jgi:hypothetical protein
MTMEHWWNGTDRISKVQDENLVLGPLCPLQISHGLTGAFNVNVAVFARAQNGSLQSAGRIKSLVVTSISACKAQLTLKLHYCHLLWLYNSRGRRTSMGHSWNGRDRGVSKYLEKNLSYYHFFHHKSHEAWPSRWLAFKRLMGRLTRGRGKQVPLQ